MTNQTLGRLLNLLIIGLIIVIVLTFFSPDQLSYAFQTFIERPWTIALIYIQGLRL